MTDQERPLSPESGEVAISAHLYSSTGTVGNLCRRIRKLSTLAFKTSYLFQHQLSWIMIQAISSAVDCQPYESSCRKKKSIQLRSAATLCLMLKQANMANSQTSEPQILGWWAAGRGVLLCECWEQNVAFRALSRCDLFPWMLFLCLICFSFWSWVAIHQDAVRVKW